MYRDSLVLTTPDLTFRFMTARLPRAYTRNLPTSGALVCFHLCKSRVESDLTVLILSIRHVTQKRYFSASMEPSSYYTVTGTAINSTRSGIGDNHYVFSPFKSLENPILYVLGSYPQILIWRLGSSSTDLPVRCRQFWFDDSTRCC